MAITTPPTHTRSTTPVQQTDAAQSTALTTTTAPASPPGNPHVTPPGQSPLDTAMMREVKDALGSSAGSSSQKAGDGNNRLAHMLESAKGKEAEIETGSPRLSIEAGGAETASQTSQPKVNKGKEAAPASPTGTVPSAEGIEMGALSMKGVAPSHHDSIERAPSWLSVASSAYDDQENKLRTFAKALHIEKSFMTDEARLQPICDEVNRLVEQAKTAVAGTKNEPDFGPAIDALKKIMDHPSQEVADAIAHAVEHNAEGSAELAMAHHGRKVAGTLDQGNAESAKVYHAANFVGNTILQPAPSIIPAAASGAYKAADAAKKAAELATKAAQAIDKAAPAVTAVVPKAVPAAALLNLGAVLTDLVAIPASHTVSHMCTLAGQALNDNGGCNLRPDDPDLGLKSMVQASQDLANALVEGRRLHGTGDTEGARTHVAEALQAYRNCKGAAKINSVNQIPQSHVRAVRTGGNIGAAFTSYMGFPGYALLAQVGTAWLGQAGLMKASKTGGMAKEQEKMKMLLSLFQPLTPEHLKKYFNGPLQTSAKLASDVVQSQIGQLEQQIAEAEGFYSKPVQKKYEKLQTKLGELDEQIGSLNTRIEQLRAQSENALEGSSAQPMAGVEELGRLNTQLTALQSERANVNTEFQEMDKEHKLLLKKLGHPVEAEETAETEESAAAGTHAPDAENNTTTGTPANRWPGRFKSMGNTVADLSKDIGSGAWKGVSWTAGATASALGTVGNKIGAGGLVGGLNILKEEAQRYTTDFGEGLDLETQKATLAALKADLALLKKLPKEEHPDRIVTQLSGESKATLELFAATVSERGEETGFAGSLKYRPNIARASMRHGFSKMKNPAEAARMFTQKGSAVMQLGGVAGSQSSQLLGAGTKVASAFGKKASMAAWWGIQAGGAGLSLLSNYRSPDLINFKNNVAGPAFRKELADNKLMVKHDKTAPVGVVGTSFKKMFANGVESGAWANFVGVGGSLTRRTGLAIPNAKTGWRSPEVAAEMFLTNLAASATATATATDTAPADTGDGAGVVATTGHEDTAAPADPDTAAPH